MARYRILQRAPYYDSESYNRYRDLMAQTETDEQKNLLRRSLRQEADESHREVGSVTVDPDMKNYNAWRTYDINDPDRPELPEMHSGPNPGGTPAMNADYRTDQYLEKAAWRGDLDKLSDLRSREFRELYGPRGVLAGNNYKAIGGDNFTKLREVYRDQGAFGAILAYREMKKKMKKRDAGGISIPGPIYLGQARKRAR